MQMVAGYMQMAAGLKKEFMQMVAGLAKHSFPK